MSVPNLFSAIAAADADAVRALLTASPELARACAPAELAPGSEARWSALHAAVQADDATILELLLDAGAELDARNDAGRTAAHDAFEGGRKALATLLERGCEVDAALASALGRVDELADIMDEDPYLAEDPATGLNPLGWASYGNQPEAVQELVSRGARIEGHELICAGSCGHADVARKLLELGADPNACDADGRTPLHAAASLSFTCDTEAFVALLLESGADASAKDGAGRTPLDCALDETIRTESSATAADFERIAERLRSAGANA